ncbi:MAG: phospholipase [Burkholderiales bacterium]|nr:phospholipase [Phycisphaerae bacterium]
MNRLCMGFVALIGALLSVGCGSGGSGNVKFREDSFVFNGETRNYAVYTPPGYDKAKKYPTILFLHGLFEGGSNGTSQTKVGIGPAIQNNPERWNCIVVMAQTPSNWQKGDSLDLAAATLDDATRKYNIDPARIVPTGLSNGGAGVWLLGAKYPGRFAALAPLCAYAEYDTVPKLTTLPIWAFHNSTDIFVGSGGTKEMVERINKAGGNAQVTIYGAFGHNCWDEAYADTKFVNWMQTQRRK